MIGFMYGFLAGTAAGAAAAYVGAMAGLRMVSRVRFEVRGPLPRTPRGWWYLLRENMTCPLGSHCAPKRLEHKFNGGDGAWLCCYCRLIVSYGHSRPTHVRTIR